MSSNKRPAETSNSRNVKIRLDRSGVVNECMVHYFMDRNEELERTLQATQATLSVTENRAMRLYDSRQEVIHDLRAHELALADLREDYNRTLGLLIEMSEILPIRLRRQFHGRIIFGDRPMPRVVNLISDEELTESD